MRYLSRLSSYCISSHPYRIYHTTAQILTGVSQTTCPEGKKRLHSSFIPGTSQREGLKRSHSLSECPTSCSKMTTSDFHRDPRWFKVSSSWTPRAEVTLAWDGQCRPHLSPPGRAHQASVLLDAASRRSASHCVSPGAAASATHSRTETRPQYLLCSPPAGRPARNALNPLSPLAPQRRRPGPSPQKTGSGPRTLSDRCVRKESLPLPL